MALWDKLKTELDRAGRVAQTAIDEGKVRLEVMRVRQLADKAAQALGYAVFRARKAGAELDADSYARLSSTLAAHEAEAQRLEAQLDSVRADRQAETSGDGGAGAEAGGSAASSSTAGVDPAMGDSGGASGNPYQSGGAPGA